MIVEKRSKKNDLEKIGRKAQYVRAQEALFAHTLTDIVACSILILSKKKNCEGVQYQEL